MVGKIVGKWSMVSLRNMVYTRTLHSLGINTDIWSILGGRGLVTHCYKQRGPSLQIPMTITTKKHNKTSNN